MFVSVPTPRGAARPHARLHDYRAHSVQLARSGLREATAEVTRLCRASPTSPRQALPGPGPCRARARIQVWQSRRSVACHWRCTGVGSGTSPLASRVATVRYRHPSRQRQASQPRAGSPERESTSIDSRRSLAVMGRQLAAAAAGEVPPCDPLGAHSISPCAPARARERSSCLVGDARTAAHAVAGLCIARYRARGVHGEAEADTSGLAAWPLTLDRQLARLGPEILVYNLGACMPLRA